MKRILILTILLMSSLAWAGSTTVVVGQGGGGAAAATCGATAAATATKYDHYDGLSAQCQGVQNSSSVQICKVNLRILNTSGAAVNFSCGIYGSKGAQQGTHYGEDVTVSVPNDTNGGIISFEWASDYPNPSGDYYIWCAPATTGTHHGVKWGADSYGSTSYFLWENGWGDRTNSDLWFEVYYME